MQEIQARLIRYRDVDLEKELSSFERLVEFSERFFADVAEIYESLTRIRNAKRNPGGFPAKDAPILGLLVRTSKVLKEIVVHYGKSNGDLLGVLARPLIESAVLATHLLKSNDSVVDAVRTGSPEERLRILREGEAQASFFTTPDCTRMAEFVRKVDGPFSAPLEDQEVDLRVVAALLRLCDEPYRLWLKRIDAESPYLTNTLNWIRTTNTRLFEKAEAAGGS